MHTVGDWIKSKVSLRPQAATESQDGIAVDRMGFDDAKVVLEVGAVSGTTPTLDVKIQESADGSTGWSDISGAAFTQVTAANKSAELNVNLRSVKRYIRAVGTIAGTDPSFTLSCEVEMGVAGELPV